MVPRGLSPVCGSRAGSSGAPGILADANIDTGIHYPVPLHLQKAYKKLGYQQGDFPVTEKVASEILSLPMYPQLVAEQQNRVAERVLDFVAVGTSR